MVAGGDLEDETFFCNDVSPNAALDSRLFTVPYFTLYTLVPRFFPF